MEQGSAIRGLEILFNSVAGIESSWSFPNDSPEKPGVYERNFASVPSPGVMGVLFCKFKDSAWYQGRKTIQEADDCEILSSYFCLPWREIKEKS